jgi:ATP-dependent Clp protease protease subunit
MIKTPQLDTSHKIKPKFDIDLELFIGRQIFLYGDIDEANSQEVIKKLLLLDRAESGNTNKKKKKIAQPVTLWINSPGGSITQGLAIIDIINNISFPVVTLVNGTAYSMAGIISICGAKRVMTKNSTWMAHDMSGGVAEGEYAEKIFARIEHLKWAQSKMFELIREKTKLTEEELAKARSGELWLPAEKCIEKGVCDVVC